MGIVPPEAPRQSFDTARIGQSRARERRAPDSAAPPAPAGRLREANAMGKETHEKMQTKSPPEEKKMRALIIHFINRLYLRTAEAHKRHTRPRPIFLVARHVWPR